MNHCTQVKGQGHFFISELKFTKLNVGKMQLITSSSACLLLDPFQRYSRSRSSIVRTKSSALLITHESLHLAWWNFAHTCTSTTSRTVLNFRVIGQRSRSHVFGFLCMRDSGATCRQYSALMILLMIHAVIFFLIF